MPPNTPYLWVPSTPYVAPIGLPGTSFDLYTRTSHHVFPDRDGLYDLADLLPVNTDIDEYLLEGIDREVLEDLDINTAYLPFPPP